MLGKVTSASGGESKPRVAPAPGGSTVTEVGYTNARKDRTRRRMSGAMSITWSVEDAK